jgi:hypothetical protein
MFSSPQFERGKMAKLNEVNPTNKDSTNSNVSPLNMIQPISIEKVMPAG